MTEKRSIALVLALSLVAVVAAPASDARAFCGFYVSGAQTSLYNNGTMVVLMRDGTRTVLSMQNDYQGPPEDFAMVVPVPVVLSEENVRTLPRALFDKVDTLAAPRLVEYWEQNPCRPPVEYRRVRRAPARDRADAAEGDGEGGGRFGVTVEAQFAVGEYDIVILSAREAGGLDRWLRANHYNIPAGADRVLRPYVESGTKFFVAKVDAERVTFQNGRALLSPLRVHYDSDDFSLPVRLGLLNSHGTQDLIVHVLSRNTRYEVANYGNVLIPTNIRVRNSTRARFGSFYTALLDRTLETHPRSVVTEYSWDASSCDPCPGPTLDPGDLATLGGDVVSNPQNMWGFTLTRLHYRYQADDLGEDLVFRAAAPVVGGTGIPEPSGRMETEPHNYGTNMFQGRYVILHRWTGELTCEHPRRGIWGGPPRGAQRPVVASRTATPPRPMPIERMILQPIPSIRLRPGVAPAPGPTGRLDLEPALPGPGAPPPAAAAASAIGCSTVADAAPFAALLLVAPALVLFARRRKRR